MKTLLITLVSLFLLGINSYATKCSCIKDDDWDKAVTWSCGRVPQSGDTIIIPAGKTVTLTASDVIEGSQTVIQVLGNIVFNNGRKMTLSSCSSFNIATGGKLTVGGGGGNNQRIEIGTRTVWTAGCSCGGCSDDCGTLITGPKSYESCTLPLKITNFQADKQNTELEFKWVSENDDYLTFSIEASADGKSWKSIATIPGGEYNYTLRTECQGSSYYRLAGNKPEVGIDYLNPVYINCDNDQEYILNLETKSLVAKNAESIQIIDHNGNILIETQLKQVDLKSLHEGMYFMILKTPDKLYKQKIALH